jgi:RecQ-mediated genome instability protein 1
MLQYLGSDLADSTLQGSGLPANVGQMEKGRIATSSSGGAVLCQMNAITEIGHSAFSLRNVRQARIDKADMAGLAAQERDESEQPPQDGEDYTIPSYPRSTLRFVLSDGFRTLEAMEYRRLPSVNLGDTPLGCKVIIHFFVFRAHMLTRAK